MVLSIIGWTLLGLLALFLLLLLLPATVYIDYRDSALRVQLRILVLRLTVYPFREGKPKREKKKKAKKGAKAQQHEEEHKKTAKKRSLEENLQLVKRLVSSASAAGRFIMRHMLISGVEFEAAVDTGDAMDTAILYGRLQGVVGAVRATLENHLNIRFKKLALVPDFAGEYPDALIFACKVTAQPVILIAAGILGLRAFLRQQNPRGRQSAAKRPAQQRSEAHGQ